jgi:hypothetical protein
MLLAFGQILPDQAVGVLVGWGRGTYGTPEAGLEPATRCEALSHPHALGDTLRANQLTESPPSHRRTRDKRTPKPSTNRQKRRDP